MRTLTRKIITVEKALGDRFLRAPWRADPEQWTLRFMAASPVHRDLLERADAYGLARNSGTLADYRACKDARIALRWLCPDSIFMHDRARVHHPRPEQIEAGALTLAIMGAATGYQERHNDPYIDRFGNRVFGAGRNAAGRRLARYSSADPDGVAWIQAQPWFEPVVVRMNELLREPTP